MHMREACLDRVTVTAPVHSDVTKTRRVWSPIAKVLIDRSTALLLLVVLLPLLVAISLAVRLTSSGPAIFAQVRTGRDGLPFTMYKFRTMCADAEELLENLLPLNDGAGPLFKMRDDPRITGLGRLLRRTSADELPQLINVLLGTMSLIGPRPALPRETADYDAFTRRRLQVRPGITGLWQVSGRSNLSWERSIRYDLDYVEGWSLTGDARIALQTVRAVWTSDGAM